MITVNKQQSIAKFDDTKRSSPLRVRVLIWKINFVPCFCSFQMERKPTNHQVFLRMVGEEEDV